MSTMTAPASAKNKKSVLMPNGPIPADRVRSRAYEIYLGRQGAAGAGDATSDWLQAERELNGESPDPTVSRAAEGRSHARGETLLASGK